jgi:hypothetical protein
MPLIDRPDFQAWLERFDKAHIEMFGDEPDSPTDRCDGCDEFLENQISMTGLCLVCLAEQFGRDEASAAVRVASALLPALARDPHTPPDSIRAAVEDILDEYEVTFDCDR